MLKYISSILFFIIIVSSTIVFTPTTTYAACTSPTGNEGEMAYNSSQNAMQFCDNTEWINMGFTNPTAGTSGCTNPIGNEAEVIYNTSQNTLQFCNGDVWVNVGDATKPTATGTACTSPAGNEGEAFYNSTAKNIQFCNGDEWVNAKHSFYDTSVVSCQAYLNMGRTTSGVYSIDPDGPGGDAPFDAYCEMTLDGGGYMMCQHAITKADFDTMSNSNTVWGGTPSDAVAGGLGCNKVAYTDLITFTYKGADNIAVKNSNTLSGTTSWVNTYNSVYNNTFGCSPQRSKSTVRGSGYSRWFQYYTGPYSQGTGVNYCTARGHSWDPRDEFTIGASGANANLVVRSHHCMNCCGSNSCDSSARHYIGQTIATNVGLKIFIR